MTNELIQKFIEYANIIYDFLREIFMFYMRLCILIFIKLKDELVSLF